MKIVTTFRVKEELQNELKSLFKGDLFSFFSNITEALTDLEDVDILITYGEDLTQEIIDKAKKLKWIMVMSAGVEKLPLKAIKEKDIIVTNAKGIHKIPMAEYTVGMMLQVTKRLKQLMKQEMECEWKRHTMDELYGKNVLIVGVGSIGGHIAKLCKVFGMNTYGVNTSGRNVQFVDEVGDLSRLEAFLPSADFIVSVLPSTHETKNLLTKKHFQLMKNTAVFINIGRGDVISDSDLLDVMNEKLIAHAVLDVFEQEPLSPSHPFWYMENVTVTPHISGVTSMYLPRGFEIFKENLLTFKTGRLDLTNRINVDRGY